MASTTRSAWKNPSYLQSSFGIFMFFCSWGIWWSFFQRWLISGVGLTNAEVGTIYSINSLATLVIMFVYGVIQDQLGIKRKLVIVVSVIAACVGPFVQFVYAPMILAGGTTRWIGALIGSIVLSAGFMSGCSLFEALTERYSRKFGFEYYMTGEVNVIEEKAYSNGLRAKVKCYGADDVREGVAIMRKEGVDVSITGNSTNPTRFQHPVAGTYKKECMENGHPYFSVASGGGTGRTLHPDNMAAGPASYGMTDTMGRMHGDAQFAGSSSVPAHVEMMGLIGMGNNPMVGATVAVAVAIEEACK